VAVTGGGLLAGYETRAQSNSEALLENKLSTHAFIHDFAQGVWGGISDDPSQDMATIEMYPNRNPQDHLNLGVAKFPYSYWKRGLDTYTELMQIVVSDIGGVLDVFEICCPPTFSRIP
jgi:uncharacterized sulfatase